MLTHSEWQKQSVDAEDKMRSDLYGLLGRLLFAPPDQKLLTDLAAISGDDSDMGRAFSTTKRLASSIDLPSVVEEYEGLFIGMGRGELLPYASYYLTGFLNEKPLAKLRNTMRDFGIAQNDDVAEPEDHIGSLCEMMSGMIVGRYGDAATLAQQQDFFETHIQPWAGHFFSDLEAAELSRFYQPVGTIGRLFVEIEKDAFSMQ